MRLTTQACDAWTATMHRRLDTIQTAILDLIDVGPADRPPVPRKPTARERRSQDRADGHFAPTPKGNSRTPYHVSNPTHTQAERWETEVEEAVTALYGTVAEVVAIVGQLGLTPTDEEGSTVVCPAEPDTRRTTTGRLVVELHPAGCRRPTVEAVAWLGAACDALIDRARRAEADAGEMVGDRARYVESLSGTLARRVGVAEGRTCTCGRPAPVGEGRKCGACGMLEMRSRTAS